MIEDRDMIKQYLDNCIRHWRIKKKSIPADITFPDNFGLEQAKHYIDAYQSVRLMIFGEILE